MRVSDAWGKYHLLSTCGLPGYGSCYLREPDAKFTKNYTGECTILTDAHTCAQTTRLSFPETWESRSDDQLTLDEEYEMMIW